MSGNQLQNFFCLFNKQKNNSDNCLSEEHAAHEGRCKFKKKGRDCTIHRIIKLVFVSEYPGRS